MRTRRDRNGLRVPFLSRTGSFVRRPSVVDMYGSNPRPLADPLSSYDTCRALAEAKLRPRTAKSTISPMSALLAAWGFVARYSRTGELDEPGY